VNAARLWYDQVVWRKGSQMSEQARKVKNEAIPQWAEGPHSNKGLFSEALVYHNVEAI
jgi:hypothetical protein